MKQRTLAIDLAKTVFEVAVSNYPGKVSRRRRLTRAQLPCFVQKLPPTTLTTSPSTDRGNRLIGLMQRHSSRRSETKTFNLFQ